MSILSFHRRHRLWASFLLRSSKNPCLHSGDATCLPKDGDTMSTPLTMVSLKTWTAEPTLSLIHYIHVKCIILTFFSIRLMSFHIVEIKEQSGNTLSLWVTLFLLYSPLLSHNNKSDWSVRHHICLTMFCFPFWNISIYSLLDRLVGLTKVLWSSPFPYWLSFTFEIVFVEFVIIGWHCQIRAGLMAYQRCLDHTKTLILVVKWLENE